MISFSHTALHRIISTEYQKSYNQVLALGEAFRAYQLAADKTGDIPSELLAELDIKKNNMSLIPPYWGGDPDQTPCLRIWTSEQLGYSDAALGFAMPGPSLAMPVTQAIATKSQIAWYASLFQQDVEHRWGAFALSERGLGSDFSHLKTVAEQRKNHWILRGTKSYVGNCKRATEGIVFANIAPNKGRFGIRAFFVDFQLAKIVDNGADMHGLRCLQIKDVIFEDLEIPLENILGFENGGPPKKDAFVAAQYSFNYMRPMLAAAICGTTRRILDCLGKDFSSDSLLRNTIESLRFDTELALTQCYKAAIEQEKGLDASLSSAIAKYEAAQVNHQACGLVAQRYGPALYQVENVLIEKLFRDSYCFRFMEGTEENQRKLIHQVSFRHSRMSKLSRISRTRVVKESPKAGET